jgi:sorbose reductase
LELISRFAEPKEIGDLAVLMCSERNTPWMTGSDVVIDGGKFPTFIMGKS